MSFTINPNLLNPLITKNSSGPTGPTSYSFTKTVSFNDISVNPINFSLTPEGPTGTLSINVYLLNVFDSSIPYGFSQIDGKNYSVTGGVWKYESIKKIAYDYLLNDTSLNITGVTGNYSYEKVYTFDTINVNPLSIKFGPSGPQSLDISVSLSVTGPNGPYSVSSSNFSLKNNDITNWIN